MRVVKQPALENSKMGLFRLTQNAFPTHSRALIYRKIVLPLNGYNKFPLDLPILSLEILVIFKIHVILVTNDVA